MLRIFLRMFMTIVNHVSLLRQEGAFMKCFFYGNSQKNSKPPFKGDLLSVIHSAYC
ncbi:hypothetical protein PPSQR21_041660 [Paenibacillus polymyxa SQR-21]|uniref:Uncharacterized protein n=1 Tax=Paenibacillus polymyxa TaxID=1406 RepID=A0A378Y5L0_PAEPO|nr:hypothetical protein PPSQR21_041660 [Paenibacillus polymyxa SQR-21]SEJ87942.1 hypothetical protein SAMN04488600_105279 [Paenibacillus polymyxa]SUA71647.1 Uncharacterised protein [Paenibacillus polymyxa]